MSSGLRVPLSHIIVELGPPMGEYRGCKIAEWVKAADGSQSNFWGVAKGKADEERLEQGQIMLGKAVINAKKKRHLLGAFFYSVINSSSSPPSSLFCKTFFA